MGTPKRITIRLDKRMVEAFDQLKSEYLERDGTVLRDGELARILIRSALDNEPQQMVADEALMQLSAVTFALGARLREVLQAELPEILGSIDEG